MHRVLNSMASRNFFIVFLLFSCLVFETSAEKHDSRERSFINKLHRNFKGLGIVRYPVCRRKDLDQEDENLSEMLTFAPSPEFYPSYSPSPSVLPPPSPFIETNSSSSSSSVDRQFEWTFLNIAAIILASLCAMLANSAGIGGGPLFMPLFNSVLGFDVDVATALSHTVVSSSSIASTCYGTLQPNPMDKRLPLIDYTLALTFIPPLLIGANLGVILNTVFPEWSQSLGLCLLLSYVAKLTYDKAAKTWQVESRLKELEAAEIRGLHPLPGLDEEEGREDEGEGEGEGIVLKNEESIIVESKEEALEEDYDRMDSPTPFKRLQNSVSPLLKLISLWVVFLLFTLSMSNAESCSFQYFALWGGQTIFCLVVTSLMIWHVQNAKVDRNSGMNALLLPKNMREGEGEGEERNHLPVLLKLAFIMLASGTIAGLLGIGGGVVYNPFFLSMGVHPQVTASTSVFMILFSSSAIFISFYLQGLLNTSYASVFAPFCFCASLLGVVVVGRVVKKTKRASIIIFILTFYMVLGAILTLILGGYSAIEDFESQTDIGFQPFCS